MNNILENLKLTNQTDLKQKNKTKHPLNKNNRHSVFCHDNRHRQHCRHSYFCRHTPQTTTTNLPPTPNHPHPQHHHTHLYHTNPTHLQTLQTQFKELLNTKQGEKIKKKHHTKTAKPKKAPKPTTLKHPTT